MSSVAQPRLPSRSASRSARSTSATGTEAAASVRATRPAGASLRPNRSGGRRAARYRPSRPGSARAGQAGARARATAPRDRSARSRTGTARTAAPSPGRWAPAPAHGGMPVPPRASRAGRGGCSRAPCTPGRVSSRARAPAGPPSPPPAAPDRTTRDSRRAEARWRRRVRPTPTRIRNRAPAHSRNG